MAILALFPWGQSVTAALHSAVHLRKLDSHAHVPSWLGYYIILHGLCVCVASLVVFWAVRTALPPAPPETDHDALRRWRLTRSWYWLLAAAGVVVLLASVVGAAWRADLANTAISYSQIFNLILLLVGIPVFLSVTQPGVLGVLWHSSRPLRLEAITVAAFTAVLIVAPVTPDQTLDAMRAWASAHWSVPLFALAGALAFALVLHESSLLMVHPMTRKPVPRAPNPGGWFTVEATLAGLGVARRALIAVAFVVLGVIAYVGWARQYFSWFGVVAIVVALCVYFCVLPLMPTDVQSPLLPAEWVPIRMYRLLAVWPLVILVGALGRAIGDYLLLGDIAPASVFRLGLFAVLLIAAIVLIGEFGTLSGPAASAELDFAGDLVSNGAVWLSDRGWRYSTLVMGGVATAACLLAIALGGAWEWVFALAVVFTLGGYAIRRNGWLDPPLPYGLALPAARGLGIALVVSICWDPHEAADMVGTVGLVLFAFAAGLSALHLLMRTFYSNRFAAGSFPYRLGITRVPALAFLVVWVIVAVVFAPKTAHSVRVVDSADSAGTPPTLDEAFATWVKSQPDLQSGSAQSPRVPLILIASHGGGIRATYWTDLVLDCLVAHSSASTCAASSEVASPADLARRVFIASGVSGGGVGLAEYATELLADGKLAPGWVERRAGRDFVSAPTGYGFFHDLPGFLLGLHPPAQYSCSGDVDGVPRDHRACLLLRDRSSVLEEEMDQESSAKADPRPLLRATWASRAKDPTGRAGLVPLLVTNSTIDGGKDRLLVSAGNLANPERRDAATTGIGRETDSCPKPARLTKDDEVVPAARDLTDVVPDPKTDLRLITAAFLGARFPIIGASGRLQSASCSVSAADGGYLDNSGLLTLSAVIPALQQMVQQHNDDSAGPDIEIVLIDIDDHFDSDYAAQAGTGGPDRVKLPPLANLTGRGDYIERLGREAAYLQLPPGCVVSVRPRAHVGASAPLGWTLSDATMKDMQQSLGVIADETRQAAALMTTGCPLS